jgi:poly(A) polymerase
VRLSAQLGLRIETGTETAIRRHARLIAEVAPERVRDELFPLLARPAAEGWTERAADLGLLFVVIPELAPLANLAQGACHHLDAWRHSLAVAARAEALARDLPGMSAAHRRQVAALMSNPVGGGRPRCVLLKLAALLHDVGKPQTIQTDEEGHVHFYEHDIVGASMARAVGRRLRLARRELQYLEIVVGCHMHPPFLAQQQEVSRRAAHSFFRRTGDCAPDVLLLAWADRLSARGPAAVPEHIQRVEQLVRWLLAEWLDRGELSHPRPAVGARAIMRRYGLQPGPKVGVLLRRLTRRQAERPFADADHAWAYLDRLAAHLGARPTDSTEDDANS